MCTLHHWSSPAIGNLEQIHSIYKKWIAKNFILYYCNNTAVPNKAVIFDIFSYEINYLPAYTQISTFQSYINDFSQSTYQCLLEATFECLLVILLLFYNGFYTLNMISILKKCLRIRVALIKPHPALQTKKRVRCDKMLVHASPGEEAVTSCLLDIITGKTGFIVFVQLLWPVLSSGGL